MSSVYNFDLNGPRKLFGGARHDPPMARFINMLNNIFHLSRIRLNTNIFSACLQSNP